MKKRDGFGVIHQDYCRQPHWESLPRDPRHRPQQRCKSCGTTYTLGDHTLTPTRPTGY